VIWLVKFEEKNSIIRIRAIFNKY